MIYKIFLVFVLTFSTQAFAQIPVKLAWDYDGASNIEPHTRFHLMTQEIDSDWIDVDTDIDPNAREYLHKNVSESVRRYSLKACNDAGCSANAFTPYTAIQNIPGGTPPTDIPVLRIEISIPK